MTRALDTATNVALGQPVLPLAAIIRLDILDDPLFGWTGIGDLSFSGTGDAALDGFTFNGLANVVTIQTVSEQVGGSQVLEVSLPGVDPTQPAFRQVIYDRRRWQFRRAWLWLMLLDPNNGAVVGKPFRLKTGRIDQMPYSETDKGGIITCRIEGQQAYGREPLNTRYSEQKQVNPNDVSQDYVFSLANMTAALGQASARPTTPVAVGYGGGGGRSDLGDILNFV